MTYATLIVHVQADAEGQARAALASDVADRFGATLVGVAARDFAPLSVPPTGPGLSPSVLADMTAVQEGLIRAELAAAEDAFRAAAGWLGTRAVWRASIGAPTRALTEAARASDLLVIGRPTGRADPAAHPDPGDVLMRAGRPVLVVPPGASHLDAARVVVAWKDGRETRRAVADALPLLRRASRVPVVELCRPGDAPAATPAVEEVVEHLARHGVAAAADVQEMAGGVTADALVRAAERHGADLIVAGGYGHTRLREWVFGGVTRSLLRCCPMCCLLSH